MQKHWVSVIIESSQTTKQRNVFPSLPAGSWRRSPKYAMEALGKSQRDTSLSKRPYCLKKERCRSRVYEKVFSAAENACKCGWLGGNGSIRQGTWKSAYKKTVEKARGKTEKIEYWQTDDISWLSQKKGWAGLKTIILTRNTVIGEGGEESREERYFISGLPEGVEEAARAVRGHWMVESCHWHLDVTFREDGNHTIEKQAPITWISWGNCHWIY